MQRNRLFGPVRFAASMATLDRQGYGVFIEIGPQPILLGMGRASLATAAAKLWLPSLRSVSLDKPDRKGYNSIKGTGSSDWQTMLQSLAALYVRGAKVNWSAFDRDYTRHLVQLPTYPFQRQRFWWPDAGVSLWTGQCRHYQGEVGSKFQSGPVMGNFGQVLCNG